MNLNDVKIYKCDDKSLYENPILNSSINLLLDLPDVVNRIQGTEYDSAIGQVLTSAGNEYSDITICFWYFNIFCKIIHEILIIK